MPPGYIHISYWKKFLPLVVLISFGFGFIHFSITFFFLVGYLLGYFIDPDLDQVSITKVEGRMLRIFGCIGAIFVGYWFPYGYIMRHRSFWSHFPMVSTAIRIVYGFWWIVPILYHFHLLSIDLLAVVVWIWSGLTIADTIHWALDKVY